MWIRHQTDGVVRWHGSWRTDRAHPVTGQPLQVTLRDEFVAQYDGNGNITHWTGKLGKDEFVVYND